MDDRGILKLVVKIKYSKKSLDKDELRLLGGLTRYLYFYGKSEDFNERMEKAWKPGAKATLVKFSAYEHSEKVASTKKGKWI